MLRMMDDKEYFTASEYMRLNGCNRTTAIRDLNELMEDGRIKKLGHGKAVLYVPVNKKEEV